MIRRVSAGKGDLPSDLLRAENTQAGPRLTLRAGCWYGAIPMGRSLRKFLFVVLALTVVGGLLYRFRHSITLEGFRWPVLVASVREARLSLLLLSIAAVYLAYAIRALRWMRFSQCLGPVTFPHVYSATLMGFACVFLLGRAGEPVRPLLIARKDSLPVSSTFGIYVLERVMDFAATAVLAGVALLVFSEPELLQEDDPLLTAARTTGVALLVGLVAILSFLIYFRFHGAGKLAARLERAEPGPGWRAKLAGIIAGFSEGLQCIRTWSDLFWTIGYTLAHWLLIVCIYLWVPHSFGGSLASLTFVDAMLLLAFTMVGSALQLPGVGGGSQLATFLVLTVIFGVEKEPAAAVAIVLWLITFAASSLAGLPLLVGEGWSMGALRSLARAEAEAEAVGTHVALGANREKVPESPR